MAVITLVQRLCVVLFALPAKPLPHTTSFSPFRRTQSVGEGPLWRGVSQLTWWSCLHGHRQGHVHSRRICRQCECGKWKVCAGVLFSNTMMPSMVMSYMDLNNNLQIFEVFSQNSCTYLIHINGYYGYQQPRKWNSMVTPTNLTWCRISGPNCPVKYVCVWCVCV